MTAVRALFAILWLVLGTCSAALAQDLGVEQQRGLSFGDVYPEMEKSISYSNADAASYRVTGEAGREVQLTFDLPDHLAGSDNETLPIAFENSDAAYHATEDPNNATAFDPKNSQTETLNQEGELYIWLGGTVYPDGTQSGGDYTNEIILDVTYTN